MLPSIDDFSKNDLEPDSRQKSDEEQKLIEFVQPKERNSNVSDLLSLDSKNKIDPKLKNCHSQDCVLSNSIFDAERMYDSVRVQAMKKKPKYDNSPCKKNSSKSNNVSLLSSSISNKSEEDKLAYEAPYYHAIKSFSKSKRSLISQN